MGELLLGCSGWNYGDTSEKGGRIGVFYPDKDTKRLIEQVREIRDEIEQRVIHLVTNLPRNI